MIRAGIPSIASLATLASYEHHAHHGGEDEHEEEQEEHHGVQDGAELPLYEIDEIEPGLLVHLGLDRPRPRTGRVAAADGNRENPGKEKGQSLVPFSSEESLELGRWLARPTEARCGAVAKVFEREERADPHELGSLLVQPLAPSRVHAVRLHLARQDAGLGAREHSHSWRARVQILLLPEFKNEKVKMMESENAGGLMNQGLSQSMDCNHEVVGVRATCLPSCS